MAYESPWQDPNQQYPSFGSPMGGSLASGYQQSSGVGYDPSSGDNWGIDWNNIPTTTTEWNPHGGNTYDQEGTPVSSDPWGFMGEQQQGGNQGNWWDSFLPGGGDPRIQGMNLPLAAMAAKQFYDAGQYGDMGNTAAGMADPFGTPERQKYRTKLWDIYNDPAKVLADPQHQAIMNSQLNTIQARNRAGGYMGSGKDFTDMANYSAQENAKYLNDEKARLAMLSGAQFDPGNAANMYMQGQRLKLDAQNGAMGALGMMYMNNYGQPQSTQNRPGIPGYGNGGTPQIPGMGGGGQGGGGNFNPGGLMGGLGGMNFGQGQPFAPDLSSPYWSQFTPGNYDPNLIGQQEMDVHQGNMGPGNTGYDEFGGQLDQWGNPFGTDYGSMGPFQDAGDWTSGDELGGWGDTFDPFSWFND